MFCCDFHHWLKQVCLSTEKHKRTTGFELYDENVLSLWQGAFSTASFPFTTSTSLFGFSVGGTTRIKILGFVSGPAASTPVALLVNPPSALVTNFKNVNVDALAISKVLTTSATGTMVTSTVSTTELSWLSATAMTGTTTRSPFFWVCGTCAVAVSNTKSSDYGRVDILSITTVVAGTYRVNINGSTPHYQLANYVVLLSSNVHSAKVIAQTNFTFDVKLEDDKALAVTTGSFSFAIPY